MSEAVLTGQYRQVTGKGSARRLRRAGQVPGVLYGAGQESTPVAVDARQLERLAHGAGVHGLVELQLQDGDRAAQRKVLIKELQRDPVTGAIVHVDLHAVALDQELETTVPVEAVGSPADGVVNLLRRELTVSCLPADIPEVISVDVSGLEVGAQVTVQDLTVPPGVRVRHDPDDVVLTIIPTRTEAAPEAEAPAGEAGGEGESSGEAGAGGEGKEE